MQPPLYVRPLADAEPGTRLRVSLKAALHSSDAFTVRRSQVLLASARRDTPPTIAHSLSCASQTVRNTIRAFNERGLDALRERSHCNHTIHTTIDAAGLEQLQGLAHRSPRDFGHPTSLWTLELLAEESFRQQLTSRRVSDETIRCAIKRLGVSWKRAKHWITSPDPAYARKKGNGKD